uniref:Serine/threonine-protein phosphatase n=1 Tax=Romanomermis culicivorax TaxID=13658 RepID=A0A915I3P3_ROMCU
MRGFHKCGQNCEEKEKFGKNRNSIHVVDEEECENNGSYYRISPIPPKAKDFPEKLTLKSAVLIQSWYRRCAARLEARRRATWNIFTRLEYEGEQDQLKLHTFFIDLMNAVLDAQNISKTEVDSLAYTNSALSNGNTAATTDEELDDEALFKATDPDSIEDPDKRSYKGPQITFPLDSSQIDMLMHAFKDNKLLHAKYLLTLLHNARRVLKTVSTVVQASTSLSKQITVCGDLHGSFDDLKLIFYKNGFPSTQNPYIFNGDFVDRGGKSVEIVAILLSCFLLNPDSVVLNRGNHEDHIMNLRCAEFHWIV